jgi:neuronal PAS domain-containing protein 1/3
LTHYYRIMNKNGGYTWIQTCATVVCSVKNADEQNIICVNYIISGRENGNFILDQCQLGIIKREPIVYPKNDNEPKSPNDDNSRNSHDVKGNIKHNENRSTVGASTSTSLETSNKVAERPNQNCDDEVTTAPATSKRGRKRKVKCESKHESPENHSEMSVKELENAMSRHLPKSSQENATDFSADTLLRQQHSEADKIHLGHGNSQFHSSSPMPATALLRQLYANRESVIRATTRPTNYMYSDGSQQQSLPTPPNDSYDSQYLRKSGEFGNLVSTYGGAYPSMEYSNAMTPPSSVSPRDLTSHKTNYEYTNLTSSSDNRVQYQSNNQQIESNSLQHLPLKPQPYSIHQMDSTYSIDQSQYFPYHSGFHLYHKGVYTPP